MGYESTTFIWRLFRQSNQTDRKNVTWINLTIEPIDGKTISYTKGHAIEVNSNYIGNYSGDIKREYTGILYHEVTHVWQWNGNGNGNAPEIIIEGIADYVRLKANCAPPDWPKPGAGNKWNESSVVTAHFLVYCNSLERRFVASLNTKMRTGYSDNFFVELLGKTVDQLWGEYKTKYAK